MRPRPRKQAAKRGLSKNLKQLAEALIAALYGRDLKKASELFEAISKRLSSGRCGNDAISAGDRAIVADAMGRMLTRHCGGQHLTEADCGFERISTWAGRTLRETELTIRQSGHYEMFLGLWTYHRADYTRAAEHFERARVFGDHLKHEDLAPISRLYLGRCAHKVGAVPKSSAHPKGALEHYRDAHAVLKQLHPEPGPLSIVIEVLKLGANRDRDLLKDLHEQYDAAAAYLKERGDYATLGHIWRQRGQSAMRAGRLEEAAQDFAQAIDSYRSRHSNHRGAARARTNLARATMLLAAKEPDPLKRSQLLKQSHDEIARAEATYAASHERGRKPEIDTLKAELALIENDVAGAQSLALDALNNASRQLESTGWLHLQSDISTAYIVLCKCHLNRAQGHRASERVFSEAVEQAELMAESALEAADKLSHPRRIARAHVWLGLARIANPAQPIGRALHELSVAEATLPSFNREYVYQELQELKAATNARAQQMRVDLDHSFQIHVREIEEHGWKEATHRLRARATEYYVACGLTENAIRQRIDLSRSAVRKSARRLPTVAAVKSKKKRALPKITPTE